MKVVSLTPLLAVADSDGECKANCSSYGNHHRLRQRDNKCSDLIFRNCLQVVAIDNAISRHAVIFREKNFRRNIADGTGYGGNSDFTKILQHRISRQDENGHFLIWPSKFIPTNFAAFHSSPQACSLSQTENSSPAAGCRSYPWRCLLSSCSMR